MTEERLPPYDIAAEECTIGSLLLDGDAFDNVSFIDDSDFYDERNQWIYRAMIDIDERNDKINQITVAQELERQGKLELCGGAPYMSYLVGNVPTSIDLVHYARIVQRLSASRNLIVIGQKVEELGYKADPDTSGSINKADELILGLRRKTGGTSIVTPEDRAHMLGDRYEQLFQKENGVALKTGISSLDYLMGGGFFNGDLILLAARPGMGKSTLAQTIANNIGRRGKNVLYGSVEMGVDSLSDRDIAGLTGVPLSKIRTGGYDNDLYARICGEGLSSIENTQVFYLEDKRNPLTTARIMNAGLEMQMRYGLSLIVIDYLGILADEYGRGNYERTGYISRRTKQIARMLDVPILALHQLSREVEKRDDKRPILPDLRDAGNLEEDADGVLFMYCEGYYNESVQDNITEILQAKMRQSDNEGRNRMVKLYFDRQGNRYRGLKEK